MPLRVESNAIPGTNDQLSLNVLVYTDPSTGVETELLLPSVFSYDSPGVIDDTLVQTAVNVFNYFEDNGDQDNVPDEDPSASRDETPTPQARPTVSPSSETLVFDLQIYDNQDPIEYTAPKPDTKQGLGKKAAKQILITEEDEEDVTRDEFGIVESGSSVLGCLISPPITATPYQQYSCNVDCLLEQSSVDNANAVQSFLEWTLSNTIDLGLGELCNVGVTRIPVATGLKGIAAKFLLFWGCSALSNWIANYTSRRVARGSGVVSKVPTVYANPIDCTCTPIQAATTDLEVCNLCDEEDLNTCFIPIRNFKPNIPGNEGFKSQLQIVFSSDPKELFDEGVLTIPSPIEPQQISKELILSSLYGFSTDRNDQSFPFGKVKYEANVVPYGYLRYYGPLYERPYQEVRLLFQRLTTNLSTGQALTVLNDPSDTFRASDRDNRPFTTQGLFPVKAYILDFESLPVKCSYFDLRVKE